MLQQQSDTMSYYNTRLVRASLPWKCVGVTHEYWSCGQQHSSGRLDTLKIDDHEDGGCKADKFERDVRLLTQGLKDEPNNERYLFYLAQSFMCLDQLDEAIKWYKNRIDKGGWIEEVWYAKMMVGECYERKNEWDHALHWYLDAYEYNPARAEPLKRIATHYRVNSQPNVGYLFAKQGTRIPYPKDQLLFVSHPVYDYELDEEISIVAYYMQNKDEGFAAADKIALKKSVPSYIKEQTQRNMAFYAEAYLKNGLFQPVKIDFPSETPTRFLSLTKTKEGFDVLSKSSESKKQMLHLDSKFKLIAQNAMPERSNTPEISSNEFPFKIEHAELDFSSFNLSVAPIEFDEGYLTLVHEDVASNPPTVLHRFLLLDKNFNVNKLSRPFFFRSKSMEDCSGMVLDKASGKCFMTVNNDGQKPEVVVIDVKALNSLLGEVKKGN
jgi:hypothetical protein